MTPPPLLTINELAKQATVAPDTVRYYVRIGVLKPASRMENGYKLFSSRDVQRLIFIRQAKRLGFTLSEISDILSDADLGNSPCPKVRDIIQRRIEETKQRIAELSALQDRMEAALAQWEDLPDGVPDGHTVCHLIESSS